MHASPTVFLTVCIYTPRIACIVYISMSEYMWYVSDMVYALQKYLKHPVNVLQINSWLVGFIKYTQRVRGPLFYKLKNDSLSMFRHIGERGNVWPHPGGFEERLERQDLTRRPSLEVALTENYQK